MKEKETYFYTMQNDEGEGNFSEPPAPRRRAGAASSYSDYTSQPSRHKKIPYKKSKFAKRTFAFTGLCVVLIYAFLFTRFFFGSSIFGDVTEGEAFGGETVEDKIVVLLVGCDKIATNTDTIMLAIYDSNLNRVDIVSIPRDTRVSYGNGNYSKINAIYHIYENKRKGTGIVELRNKVYEISGIYADHYVMINTECFKDMIDAVDGVYFDVPQNMNYEDPAQNLYIHLKKGPQTLNGKQAEQLVRFRQYPMADIDRTAVQRDFISALISQKMNTKYISKASTIYSILEEECSTDISLSKAIKYARAISGVTPENIVSHILPGKSTTTGLGSVWIYDVAETKALASSLGFDNVSVEVISLPVKSGGNIESKDDKAGKTDKSDKNTDTKKDTAKDDSDNTNTDKKPSDSSNNNPSDKNDTSNNTDNTAPTETPGKDNSSAPSDSPSDSGNESGGDSPAQENPGEYPDGI